LSLPRIVPLKFYAQTIPWVIIYSTQGGRFTALYRSEHLRICHGCKY
jgi:hypothetical protein